MQIKPNPSRNESKIIISDWGGVVSHSTNNWVPWWENYIREVHAETTRSTKDIIQRVKTINLLYGIESTTDKKKILAYYKHLSSILESPFSAKEMRQKYVQLSIEYGCYDYIGDYIRSLRDLCKTGILSNLRKDDERVINSHMRFQFWDYIWLSYEMGAEKPNPDIYKKVMQDCNIKPGNILFIDDKIENIIAAHEAGWNVSLVENEGNLEKIQNAVNKFLWQ